MKKFFTVIALFLFLFLFFIIQESIAEQGLYAANNCDADAKKGDDALAQSEKYAISSGWMDKFIGAGHAGTAESFFKLIALQLKTDPSVCVTNSLKNTLCNNYSINFTKARIKADQARATNSKSAKLIFSAQSLAYSQKYEVCFYIDGMD